MTQARAKDRLKLTQEEAFPGLMIPPFLVGSWLTTVIAGGTTHKYGAEWEAAASKRMCLRGICVHNCYTATLSSQIGCKLNHGFLHKTLEPESLQPNIKHDQTIANHETITRLLVSWTHSHLNQANWPPSKRQEEAQRSETMVVDTDTMAKLMTRAQKLSDLEPLWRRVSWNDHWRWFFHIFP